eukprot:CAMPEP_0116845182 /NCGR_PEP_ID=MMETSP0418-20121206/13120_1 /TAXON_ID=1158023 /ORGANISM="Astrosyne radiata, Strain 13vi08-1A" /LENGTH=76 /DNA_ID=CAMNT_0004476255 /DNA_START=319 /DNA_END=549 /DNA_ORIENTATION=+
METIPAPSLRSNGRFRATGTQSKNKASNLGPSHQDPTATPELQTRDVANKANTAAKIHDYLSPVVMHHAPDSFVKP